MCGLALRPMARSILRGHRHGGGNPKKGLKLGFGAEEVYNVYSGTLDLNRKVYIETEVRPMRLPVSATTGLNFSKIYADIRCG